MTVEGVTMLQAMFKVHQRVSLIQHMAGTLSVILRSSSGGSSSGDRIGWEVRWVVRNEAGERRWFR